MWEVEIGAEIYSLKWCSLHGKITIIIISLRLYHVLGIHVFQYSGNL